jgi:hypothetical protein
MSTADIKDVVLVAEQALAAVVATPSLPIFMTIRKRSRFLRKPCSLRSAAATRLLWRN